MKCYLVCLSMKGEGDPFATGSRFGLRWFTPTTEVPLCGHATLASASVLFYKRGNQQATLRLNPFHSHSRKNLSLLQKLHFETVHSGVLTATRVGSMIEMELPLNPPDTGNYHNAPRGPSFLHPPCTFQSVRRSDTTDRGKREKERLTHRGNGDLICIELSLTFQDASRGILPLGVSRRPPSVART